MAGHGRPADRQLVGNLTDGTGGVRQERHDGTAMRVAKRFEWAAGGSCGHRTDGNPFVTD